MKTWRVELTSGGETFEEVKGGSRLVPWVPLNRSKFDKNVN